MKIYLTKPWLLAYNNGDGGTGDGGTNGTGTGDGAGDGGIGGTGDGVGGTGTGTNPDDDKPTLSQKQVNKLLAEEKRKHKTVIEKQVSELEQLKKSKGLTDKEKGELQGRIEELQNSMLTKEQLTEKEKRKLAEDYKKQIDSEKTEKDNWRNLYHSSTIERSIMDEALKAEAFNPNQVVALLRNSTRLVEVIDSEGNPVPGKYIAKVRLDDTDKEGKPITLDLTVAEAITRLKDRTNEYGNLFKSNLTGGLGSGAGAGRQQDFDPKTATPEQYRAWRDKRMGRKSQGNQ